jgi:hypothetical protein
MDYAITMVHIRSTSARLRRDIKTTCTNITCKHSRKDGACTLDQFLEFGITLNAT